MKQGEIFLYIGFSNGDSELEFRDDDGTVRHSWYQFPLFFGKDVETIGKHVAKVFKVVPELFQAVPSFAANDARVSDQHVPGSKICLLFKNKGS